jgi:hypothetical protein
MCTPWANRIDDFQSSCPFISDYSSEYDSFMGNDNPTIFIDYHVSSTSSGGYTGGGACRQSWTGSSVACGDFAETSGTGEQDLELPGFSTIGGTASSWDYYYLQMHRSGETVDNIWGVDYYYE